MNIEMVESLVLTGMRGETRIDQDLDLMCGYLHSKLPRYHLSIFRKRKYSNIHHVHLTLFVNCRQCFLRISFVRHGPPRMRGCYYTIMNVDLTHLDSLTPVVCNIPILSYAPATCLESDSTSPNQIQSLTIIHRHFNGVPDAM